MGMEAVDHQDTKAPSKAPRKALTDREEEIASVVVDAAVKVHKVLGPGLLESIYESCLAHELRMRGLRVSTQVTFPVVYESFSIEKGLRVDLLVEDLVILEIKAVEHILHVHEAQLLTYLKLSHKRLGFLLNFNAPLMKDGIHRRVL